jgi:hypothetical protein
MQTATGDTAALSPSNQRKVLAMRVRALFVVILAVVAAFLMVGTAYAAPPVEISGHVGEIVDRKAKDHDALRYVGKPAPRGFSHDYQWARPFITTPSPDDTPIMLDGILSLRDRVPETTAMIGLVDRAALKAGSAKRQVGAFIYVFTNAVGDVRIGLTDGNEGGGELVQRSVRIAAADVPDEVEVTFTVDGTANPQACASHAADLATADGCMTLQVGDDIVDSYGTVAAAGFDAEFAKGAVPGWEVVPERKSGVHYDLRIAPAKVVCGAKHKHWPGDGDEHGEWHKEFGGHQGGEHSHWDGTDASHGCRWKR